MSMNSKKCDKYENEQWKVGAWAEESMSMISRKYKYEKYKYEYEQ